MVKKDIYYMVYGDGKPKRAILVRSQIASLKRIGLKVKKIVK